MSLSFTNLGRISALAATLCFGLFAVGCGPAPQTATENHSGEEHDEEHEAHTFAEVMEELGGQYTTIKTAFESNSPDDAHGALHEVGHALESLTKIAEKDEEMTDEMKESLTSSVNSLYEAFGSLDDMMHGGDEVDFAEVDKKASAAMDALKAMAE